MRYDLDILAKGIGRINLDNGYFNNVLFVPALAANLLSSFQTNYTDSAKGMTFTQEDVKIYEFSTRKVIAIGVADHESKMYKFPHFLPYSSTNVLP